MNISRSDLEALLKKTEKICKKGWEILLDRSKLPISSLKTWEKGEGDFVTFVDHELESFYKNELLSILPDASFVGEEKGLFGDNINGFVWVVDPVDGTTNFSRGICPYAFSVALLFNKEPILGVIGVPPYDWFLSGAKGLGAWINGTPIQKIEEKKLDVHGVACVGIIKKEELNTWVKEIAETRVKLRFLGSAVTHIASVILGRVELAAQEKAHVWDIAGGILILEEAGGKALRLNGEPIYPFNDDEIKGKKLSFVAGSNEAVISILKLL